MALTISGACGALSEFVKAGLKIFSRTVGRVLVGGVLLFWIFYTIFLLEAERHAQSQGVEWHQLSRGEQWQNAWIHGPIELWRTLTLVSAGSLVASLFLMGATILLGVVRWRMVLKAQGLPLGTGRALEISFVESKRELFSKVLNCSL